MSQNKLAKSERALRRAFSCGELVDLSGAHGKGRIIRADVIAGLLLGTVPGEPGRSPAVRLEGARITGVLTLNHSRIDGPVLFRHCEFDSPIDLSGARTRDFELEGSRLAGLIAPLAEIAGNLSIRGCMCDGQVVLTGAHITGALRAEGCHLDHPDGVALLGNRLVIDDDLHAPQATVNGEFRLAAARVGGIVLLDGTVIRAGTRLRALNARHLTVGVRLLARRGFTAAGEVLLEGANIETNLDFRGSKLTNPSGDALVAHSVKIGGFLSFEDGTWVEGMIRISHARIGGEIYLSDGKFINPGNDAIRCLNTEARELVLSSGLRSDGTIDFRYSRFAVIRDDPSSWPRKLRLSGLRYDALDPQLPATKRVEWLRRDTDGYLPQNYETLADMYHRYGDDSGSRAVLLARERERRRQLPWYSRAWSRLQEITVGYGYRPLRAGAWLGAFLSVGTLIFGLHHPAPLNGAPHPAFNPLIYSLDLLVPLVNLDMRNTYDPQGPEQWLAYLMIAVGWIFVTTIATGITRVLRRQ